GSFSFTVAVTGPARFRASAGDELSDPVALELRAHVTIDARRSDGHATVAIAATPDQAGAPIALERYIHEPHLSPSVRKTLLGTDGRVRLVIPARRGVDLRAHLLHGKKGWGEAQSRPLVLR